MFKINEAGWDRALRVVLGVFLLSLVFIGPRTLWGLLGFIPFVTGVAGTCPLYSILGISTCPTPKESKHAS